MTRPTYLHLRLTAALAAACAAVCAIADRAVAQGAYSIRRLTAPGLAHGVAWDIDAHGDVVGELLDAAGVPHAVVWRGGVATQLPALPSGGEGSAYTIASGVIGGAAANAATPASAVVWSTYGANAWSAVDLGVAPGDAFAAVLGVHGSGFAVGFSDDGLRARPVAWLDLDGSASPTPLPMPAWAVDGAANAVIGSGRVFGYVADFGTAAAAVWDATSVGALPTLLPDLGGGSVASDANEAGYAVGAAVSPTTGHLHFVGWDQGAVRDLGRLPGTDCFAEAVNARGDAVGWARTFAAPPYCAVLAPSGHALVDLNELLPPESGWHLTRAFGIGDDGAIVGTGTWNGHREPFLMTPVHVALRGPAPAVAGAIAELAVDGASAGATVHLCVSLAGGETVVPGCVQVLDLAAAIVVASAVAGPNGAAAFRLPVPAFLANVPLFFQAYDHGGCATSNVVAVTFR